MWQRFLLVSTVAVLLAASYPGYQAPLRQGKGGHLGNGLIIEKIGELGAAGKWVEGLLRDQLVGKRVHYMRGEHSWSGKITEVKVRPEGDENSAERVIDVTVETTAGMGDQVAGNGSKAQDYGAAATITLAQISGILEEAHPHVGSSIKASYDHLRTFMLPGEPIGMFRAGDPNTIVAVYSDGYVEVDVNGMALGVDRGKTTASGTVFIRLEDIVRDENLQIVSKLDLENTDE